jgi:hypothetical protein
MMNLKKAVLKGFNSGDYTATIQLAGSRKAYLEGVAVARTCPLLRWCWGGGWPLPSSTITTPKKPW